MPVSERLITPKSTVWLRQAVYQADVSSRVYLAVTAARNSPLAESSVAFRGVEDRVRWRKTRRTVPLASRPRALTVT